MDFVSKVAGVAKEAAALRVAKKKAVDRELKASFDFIALSRKTVLSCSGCKMTDEIWSLSGLAVALMKNEWTMRHKECDGIVETHDR